MYAFAKSLALLVLPPSGPILVVFAGLLLGVWRPTLGRVVAIVGALTLWLASTPLVVSLLITTFGSAHSVTLDEAKGAQAIVILGGGVRRSAQEYGGDTLGQLTLERVRYGAALARRTGLPVLVTGGTPPKAAHAEADLMRQALEVEFRIDVKWVENRSANTRENAVNSAALLHKDGVARVVLVTHAFDAPRARLQFERAGIQVVAAPTQIPQPKYWTWVDLLPSARAMSNCFYLGYEGLARLADRLVRGR